MIDVIPARAEMAAMFRLQTTQQALSHLADEATLAHAIENGIAMAVVDGPRILAIGGVMRLWEDRGNAWGLLSDDIGAAMPVIHKTVARVLTSSPLSRIEAQVAVGHEAGQRWVRLLGFKHEGRMAAFWQGQDYDLFARVR